MHLTCSLTLAVSRGKVTRSAMQPAVPAPKNLMAVEGASSVAMPTIAVLGGMFTGFGLSNGVFLSYLYV